MGDWDHEFALPVPAWKKAIRMTAIAVAYSSHGFALAAEGKQAWGEQPVPQELAEFETDEAQKIFPITGNQFALGFTIRGDSVSRDRSFDFGIELQNQAMSLGARYQGDCYDFVKRVSAHTVDAIERAIKTGVLDGYMEVYCIFVGYFRGRPSCIHADFSQNTGIAKVSEERVYLGWKDLKSSPKIVAAFERNDPIFAQFHRPFDKNSSLQEAVDFAEGFINASCYLPATHQIDSENAGYFGGLVHVATITPPDRPDRSLQSRISGYFRRGDNSQGAKFQWMKDKEPQVS
jgi:hypothetical protein